MDVLKEVLREIKPIGKDKRVNEFVKDLQSRVDGKKIEAKVFLGGSFAKGTFLKDNYDIDIFVRFDKKYIEKDLSGLLEKCLKGLNYTRVHGSRDYFQIKDDLKFEIVPVLDIKNPEDAKNVTDMSPLHVEWVIKNSSSKLREDIILLKQFCKGIGVYGAESYIKGFSGHVVDILVIYYGGFKKVLRASLKWKDKQVIDYYKYHKGEAMWNLNKSKLQSPLIIIDPVLPSRNAAAALGYGKFNIFKKNAKDFLKKPSKSFFVVKKFDVEKYGGFVLKIEGLSGKGERVLHMKEDVVGAKLLKVYDFIMKGLKDFKVVSSGWNFDYIWFKVKDNEIEKEYERIGPSIKLKEDVKKFKLKHKKTYVKKGKVCCKIKRECYKVDDMIKGLLKDKYVKERVEVINKIK